VLNVKKSLKTTIVVALTFTITAFWGISGLLARKHAVSFFAEHESRIEAQGKHGEVLDELQQEKRSLFRELAGIRFLLAVAGILTFSLALGLMWRRRISRPMALMLQRIHEMRLGTWNRPIPVNQEDEMGKLIQEINDLGPELSLTAHQYAAASKLAAMALIGNRVVRRTMSARQRLLAVSEALPRVPADEQFQAIVVEQVRQVAGELEAVAVDFDSEFEAELARVSAPMGTTDEDPTPDGALVSAANMCEPSAFPHWNRESRHAVVGERQGLRGLRPDSVRGATRRRSFK
jgi:hypothetical protein